MNRKQRTKASDGLRVPGPMPVTTPDLPSLCRSSFDASPMPVAAVAESGHLVCYVNPAFCRLAGRSQDELVGKPFAELVPWAGSVATLDRVFRTGEAETHAEPDHLEAQPVPWSYAVWPVPGENGHRAGAIVQITTGTRVHQQTVAMNQELLVSAVRQHELMEMTERLNSQLQLEIADRKRMEQALLTNEKLAATGRLAHTMAHEINNPLGAITNLIFLLAPLQTSPEARAYVATLENQVNGLARIATQMLKFHRDANQPTEFKLSELLQEVTDFYRSEADRQQIAITTRIEAEGVVVSFRGELVQVVSNLLLNALDATPAGGKVSFHLYPAPPWLCAVHGQCGYCLSVADTGIGIDPQHYARIYEPFFTTKGEKGSGLGLWLCAGIISRIGGSIHVRSSRHPVRSGTCFSVFLPAKASSFTPRRRRYER